MRMHREVAGRRGDGKLAELLRNVSYEVLPFKSTEQAVLDEVPATVPLTVTVTEAKGISTTLELTERLLRHGYTVTPHLPARQFCNRGHLSEVVTRLYEAGGKSVFVIGGDAPEPAAEFPDANALLQAMGELAHPFTDVGIGGYPEGHATIPQEAIDLALKQKAPMATRVVTQMCFDATITCDWAARATGSLSELPIHVGMPGPVNRQKLMRISTSIGLGQSARFLRKQQSMLWRFLLPGGYNPTNLAKRLSAALHDADVRTVTGLHIFTFNELRKTESWRRELLASVSE